MPKSFFFLMQLTRNLKCEIFTTAEDLDGGAVRGTSPGKQAGSPHAHISACVNFGS